MFSEHLFTLMLSYMQSTGQEESVISTEDVKWTKC